jgi:phosphoglycerate dehydrogenase-like enzyme
MALPDVLALADVLSLHAQVTPETRGLLGPEALARLKPGAFLVNTARAALVDETALLAVLREGRLAGAALDVFWEEPLPLDSPWRTLPNVILTPHIGGATTDLERRTSDMIVDDVLAGLRGERPRRLANPQAWRG